MSLMNIEEKVKLAICNYHTHDGMRMFRVDDINLNSDLRSDLKLDNIDILDLVSELERELGVFVIENGALRVSTVEDIINKFNEVVSKARTF